MNFLINQIVVILFIIFSISCFAGIRKELNYSSDTIAILFI